MTSTEQVETRVDGTRVLATTAGEGEDAVLCLHGLASQRASLTLLVEALADHGYRALAPDLRGHGDSEGPRGRLSRQRVLADLHAWERWLEDEHGAHVQAIVGHSLGGLWAMAAQRELGAEAIAMVATPVSIRREIGPIEALAYRIGAAVHRMASPLGLELRVPYRVGLEDVLETEAAIESARRIDLVQRSIPLANASELLGLDGGQLAGEVACPAIVARPSRDRLVAEASTRALYEALPEPKRWLEIDAPHECFFDVDGPDAAARVAEALDAVLDGGPDASTSER